MSDYRELIEEARRGTGGYSEGDLRSLAKSLADAVESLVAENEKLRDAARLSRSIADEYSAERDALRAENEKLRLSQYGSEEEFWRD